MGKNSKKNNRLFLIYTGIFLLGFILRTGIFFVKKDLFLNKLIVSDALNYVYLAENILKFKTYGWHNMPTAYRPPGYSVFLAIIYKLFGQRNHIAVIIIQNLLAALIPVIIFIYTRKFYDFSTGLLTSILTATHTTLLFWSNLLWSETLFTFFLVISVYFLSLKSSRYIFNFLTGIFIGITILIRPIILVLLCLAILFYLLTNKKYIKNVLLIIAGTVLIISMWTLRNYLTFKTPVLLFTEAGFAMYTGHFYGTNGLYTHDVPLTPILKKKLENKNEVEKNIIYETEALKIIKKHPFRFFKLAFKKIFWLFYFDTKALKNFSYYFILPIFLFSLFISHKLQLLTQSIWKFEYLSILSIISILIVVCIYHSCNRFLIPYIPFINLIAARAIVFSYKFYFHSNKTLKVIKYA